jgi:hypothetical protein
VHSIVLSSEKGNGRDGEVTKILLRGESEEREDHEALYNVPIY